MMRSTRFGLLFVAALLAFGCGGGGTSPLTDGSPAAITEPATIDGKLTSRDGSITDLGGVQVFDIDTGEATTTDEAGSFSLRVRSQERVRLRLDDPRAGLPHYGEPGGGGEVDVDGDRVDCGPFEHGETCRLEFELRDGEILECWAEHGEGPERSREGEGGLWPGGEWDCLGSVQVDVDGECLTFSIEFDGLEGPEVYDVVLRDAEDNEHSLGTFAVDAEGVGTFELEWCADDALPFEAEDVDDLKGVEILVLNSLDEVVLQGRLPGGGPQHHDWGPCPGATILLPEDSGEAPDLVGFAGSMTWDGCDVVSIEAFFRETAPDELDAYLVPPEGDAVLLGTLEIGEHGFGHVVFEYCEGDALPLSAETLDDLAEHTLELRDADGTVVLSGDFPVPQDECGHGWQDGGPGMPDWPDGLLELPEWPAWPGMPGGGGPHGPGGDDE